MVTLPSSPSLPACPSHPTQAGLPAPLPLEKPSLMLVERASTCESLGGLEEGRQAERKASWGMGRGGSRGASSGSR